MPKKPSPRRSKPRKGESRAVASSEASSGHLGKLLDALPLVGFFALVIATCLVPSETPPAFGWEIPLVMGWMLLLGTWAIVGMLRRTLVMRYDLALVAVALLLLWICLSSIVNLGDSRPRATINMTFRWLSFGVMFFLARQLLVTPQLQRAAVGSMIALAIGLSALGLFEYGVVQPAKLAAYEANPTEAMRSAGIYADKDSPAGQQFRDRVNSVEPLATFALTNSLAGFLTPWLLVSFAICWQVGRLVLQQQRSGDGLSSALLLPLIAIGIGAVLIAFCMLLTKSRSAWGATAIGLFLLLAGAILRGLKADWKWVLGGAGLVLAMIGIAIAAGGIDREVLSEAGKSLSVRVQYWQATGAMISEHPVVGVGVGNFQERYAAYKLPVASEMIGDPHNFILQVAATAGLPALIPLLALLVATAWYSIRPMRQSAESPIVDNQQAPEGTLLPIYFGVALGFVVAIPLQLMSVGLNLSFLLIAAPVTGCALLALSHWITDGELPVAAIAVALCALLVNLLAAGGIGFASVSLQVWLLAAIIGCAAPACGTLVGARRLSRGQSVAVVVTVSLLVATFYFLAYRPVLNGRIALQSGERLVLQGKYRTAIGFLQTAAEADPWNSEPFRLLAVAHQRQWLVDRRREQLAAFERFVANAIRRNPYAHTLRTEMGHRYLEVYRANDDPTALGTAIEYQQAAAKLNPGDSFVQAQLAWLYSVADRTEEARDAAAIALELDRINTHKERILASRVLFDTEGNLPENETPVELMRRLAPE